MIKLWKTLNLLNFMENYLLMKIAVLIDSKIKLSTIFHLSKNISNNRIFYDYPFRVLN